MNQDYSFIQFDANFSVQDLTVNPSFIRSKLISLIWWTAYLTWVVFNWTWLFHRLDRMTQVNPTEYAALRKYWNCSEYLIIIQEVKFALMYSV